MMATCESAPKSPSLSTSAIWYQAWEDGIPQTLKPASNTKPIGSMYGIYANMTGVYWWDPCCHIYHTWIPWDTNQISLVSQCSDWAILGRGVSCKDKIHAIHVAWLTSHDQSYIAGNPRARNETQQEQLNVHGWTVWRHHRWPVKQLRHVAPFGCQSE